MTGAIGRGTSIFCPLSPKFQIWLSSVLSLNSRRSWTRVATSSVTRKCTRFATLSPAGASVFPKISDFGDLGTMFAVACCVHQQKIGMTQCTPPPIHLPFPQVALELTSVRAGSANRFGRSISASPLMTSQGFCGRANESTHRI